MFPTKAILEAKRLAKEGMKYADIATRLKDAGYVGRRGTPLTPVGVSQLLIRNGVRRRRKGIAAPILGEGGEVAKSPRSAPQSGKLGAVHSILLLKGMDAEEKIALALLVMDGGKS